MANETAIVPNYLPPPKYIPIPNARMSLHAKPNYIYQADILYIHDKYKKKIYTCSLNIVDVASRCKGSYQLTTKIEKSDPGFLTDIWRSIINLSKDNDN